ncbi:MAG: DNA-processing protein DprA [Desulfovibrio sp.]|jgi:DNA processing protein|nr:DNA-processing protein DprA [Desulfovibrio sp.]
MIATDAFGRREELRAILALRHCPGLGLTRAERLLRTYGSARAVLAACRERPEECAAGAAMPLSVARNLNKGGWREEAEAELEAMERLGCPVLLCSDPAYPELLREIPDAPPLLYCRGDMSLLGAPAIGVVGARGCTSEGLAVSAFFARALSEAGVSVISGMARGIDRAAQLAAMEKVGRSIGVLGSGIDLVYPAENADLFARLEKDGGLLISEFPPRTPPAATNFPRRNRLISGLSRGVLVVEASRRSGSLITARLALEQNREVFAVPGHTLSPASAGCRELIRKGAKAVFNADDILVELAHLLAFDAREALEKRLLDPENAQDGAFEASTPHSALRVPLKGDREARKRPLLARPGQNPPLPRGLGKNTRATGADIPVPADPENSANSADSAGPEDFADTEEARILAALAQGTAHIDVLSRSLGLDAARVSALLALLEVRGRVRRLPGMNYALP